MITSLAERDKKVIWHPYTQQKYAPDPIPIVKGEGSWLFDEKGNRYIDAISSWWVTIHGHAHPYIAEKIYRQALALEQVIFTGFTHEPAVRLAERLLPILPGHFSRVFYSDNGSTATEVAIKMAIQFWWNQGDTKRTRIIALSDGYHGDTFGAMSVSQRSLFTLAFQDRLFDVLFVDLKSGEGSPLTFEGFDAVETDRLLSESACLIYEPLVQGAGGMKMYEPAVLNALLNRCQAAGVVCIADEVMTGFGRTGKLFASEYCTASPDIICLSKGLTGGTLALGATVCTARIYEAFNDTDKRKSFFHGHSFTANPIACASALASLDLIEKQSCRDDINRIVLRHGEFCERLRSSMQALNIKNIRQQGTILAFEIITGTDGYASNIRERVTEKALEKGIYLRPLGNTVYLMPPYCTDDEQLQTIYNGLVGILQEIA